MKKIREKFKSNLVKGDLLVIIALIIILGTTFYLNIFVALYLLGAMLFLLAIIIARRG